MKVLRMILIALVAPATILLGLTKLGDTPISRGYNVGFLPRLEQDSSGIRLAMATDVGDLTCWVELKVPSASPSFTAKLSTDTALSVYRESVDGPYQWIAIVAGGQKHQDKFKWPSGANVYLYAQDNQPSSLALADWRVYLSDKDHDSKEQAEWRTRLLWLSGLLLVLALVGGGLEGYAKLTETPAAVTPQYYVEVLIRSTAGLTRKETKWMRSILRSVLMEGLPADQALAAIPLSDLRRRALWFKTRANFRARLGHVISELSRYSSSL